MSTYDPFAPPSSDTSQSSDVPLPTGRPTGVPKVFGVLSIVFASLMLLYSLIKMLGGAMASAVSNFNLPSDTPQAADMQDMMFHMGRVYRALAWEGTMVLVLSALLIGIGVGQIKYREWARRWTMYWGVMAMAAIVVMVLLSMVVIGPAYQDMFNSVSRAGLGAEAAPLGMAKMFGGTSAVLTVLVYSPYPTLLLIFFSRPHVRAAMTR